MEAEGVEDSEKTDSLTCRSLISSSSFSWIELLKDANMRVEKRGSKGEGGRYSGGFLYLFNWNVKARKKLLYKGPASSEQPKQKRGSNTYTPISQPHPAIEDHMAGSLSLKGSSVSSCSSSPMNEHDYRKSPGVVARLMGLDSLPSSKVSETPSNHFFDSRSLPDSPKDCHQMVQKHQVIEKFRTESLPPKSARPVPVTQNKLLSPIKSSGFVSPDDRDRIMRAASKIPLVRSSSAPSSARKPSKVPRRPGESNAARNLKGQSMNKSWDGCLEPKPVRGSEEGKKSVSLAVQAKVNVQKREGLSPSGGRGLYAAESTDTRPNSQRTTPKKPSTNSVLKPNNLKQNSLPDRGKSAAKSPVSSINSRKLVPEKSSSKVSRSKTMNQRRHSIDDVKNFREKTDRSRNVVRSNGSDVVSFTFTSPISRSNDTDKKKLFLGDDRVKNTRINFIGDRKGSNSATGSDSLGTLLDQKLRELTAMSSQESSTSYRAGISRNSIFRDDSYSAFSSNDHRVAEETSKYGNFLGGRHRSFMSLSAPSFVAGTRDFSKEITMMDIDGELSDPVTRTESESGYMKDILSDIESMFERFTLGMSQKIVNPNRFDQLEAQQPSQKIVNPNRFDQLEAQQPVHKKQYVGTLRRKLVFDCVSECIESKCGFWTRGLAAVRRKDWLAEEVRKKISGWEQMKDCAVEELVGKDVEGQLRDFDVEAFEVGVEIERQLFDSLIDEVVFDILEV